MNSTPVGLALMLLLLSSTACTSLYSLEDQRCPCLEGWLCCPLKESGICLRGWQECQERLTQDDPEALSLLAGQLGGPGHASGRGADTRLISPSGLAADAAGSLYIADGTAVLRYSEGTLLPLAGASGDSGVADGPLARARFTALYSVLHNGRSTIYVTDNHAVRALKLNLGEVQTLAGAVALPGARDGRGAAAQLRDPRGMALDEQGNLYVADAGNHAIRQIVAATGEVSTLAGALEQAGNVDGVGDAVRFMEPVGVVCDRQGHLIVTDRGAHTVRLIDLGSRRTSTLIGGGPGSVDGPLALAKVDSPTAVLVDAAGDIVVLQPGSIRKISAGQIRTLAGAGAPDPGPGSSASFGELTGVLASDKMLFVADRKNYVVQRVDSDAHEVGTLVGLAPHTGELDGIGGAARFAAPQALALAANSTTLYVADGAHTLRAIDVRSGTATTVAGRPYQSGTGDGNGSAARFKQPAGLLAYKGNLFISDTGNNTLRRLQLATQAVSTLAGQAGPPLHRDGSLQNARFDRPTALVFSAPDLLYVAEAAAIRRINLVLSDVSTLALRGTALADRPIQPTALAGDGTKFLYVVDGGTRVLRIDLATGEAILVAGDGMPGSRDGMGDAARFFQAGGLALYGQTLLVADTGNGLLRRIDVQTGQVDTWLGMSGQRGVRLGGQPAGLNFPIGTAADDKQLFIIDAAENALLVLSRPRGGPLFPTQ